MDKGVAHEECRQQGEDDNHGIEHRDASRLLEIVLAVECQVEREAHHEDGDIENLSEERYLVLCIVFVAQLVLFLERLDDAIGLLCHNLAAVHYLLSLLHQSAGQGNARQQVVLAGLAALLVVDQIGGDIRVQIAFLQDGT